MAAVGGVGRRRRAWRWAMRAAASAVLWTAVVQLASIAGLFRPRVLADCGGGGGGGGVGAAAGLAALAGEDSVAARLSPPALLPKTILLALELIRLMLLSTGIYKSNGYLRVTCNGGLNQMRAGICDMVTIARHLNLTLVVPELDKRSFWADPRYNFHITYMSVEAAINTMGITSDLKAFLLQILPLARKHRVIHFEKSDTRLANNGLPIQLQMLRCRVNFEALRFTPQIEALGKKLISTLQRSGQFVVLHLRYEMDMLSFSGCTHGCSSKETEELTRMRYAYPWWKEKEIDSEAKRLQGFCPLTPEEITLVLKALGFTKDTLIYIASGEIYGGERRLAALKAAYPKLFEFFVEKYMGFRKTIVLDRKKLVELLDLFQGGALSWDEFSDAVKEAHKNRMGQPTDRKIIPGQPKEEDYFYANPQECLGYNGGLRDVS
nr:unnamed protein product [Digitaria exilis]